MQTFMPFPTFRDSLLCLDDQRLGKQRVEGLQILNTLSGRSEGWRAHPAVRMWRGAIPALIEYTLTACELWVARGFADTTADKIYDLHSDDILNSPIHIPSWCRNPLVLDSHKAMLYHKNPVYYAQFAAFASIKDYHWP